MYEEINAAHAEWLASLGTIQEWGLGAGQILQLYFSFRREREKEHLA